MTTGTKAVFLDIDGTLSWNGVPPCDEDIDALRAVRAAGHFVLINTGRSSGFLPESLRDADYLDGFLCGCGTQLILHGKTVFSEELPRPLLRRAAAFYLARPGRRCLFEAEDGLYIVNGDYKGGQWPQVKNEDDFETVYTDVHVIKLTIIGSMIPEEKEMFGEDLEPVLQSSGHWFEAILPGRGKGRGLLHACEILGVLPENSIAVGDSENDLAMFESAGIAVAMENASADAIAAAAYMTGRCGEGGVARAVRALILGEGTLRAL